MKKIIATALGSALLAGTGVVALTSDSATVAQLKEEKAIILQDNIWKDVRLGEIPEWNPDIVSAEEMTAAYVDLANKQNAKNIPNLYDGLTEKATEQGILCVK